MEIRRTRDEDKAVRREYGGGVFLRGRGKVAGEGDTDVRVETGSPHEYEVFTQFVNAQGLCVNFLVVILASMRVGRVKEKFKGFSKTLTGIKVLEFIGEKG